MIALGALALAACGDGRDAGSQLSAIDTRMQAAAVAPAGVSPEALRAAVSDQNLRAFYEANGWRAVWTRSRARELGRALGDAERHALDPGLFLAADAGGGDPVRTEIALTSAVLAYAEALARGRVDPAKVHGLYTLPRPETAVTAGFAEAIEAGELREWLSGLAPQDEGYRALSEAYLRYWAEAQRDPGRTIGAGEAIREGDRDPRVPQIVEALRANGYLETPPEDADPTLYTAEIAAAVERIQQDYGIAADGIVGPDTLAVLNTGAAERARQLAVNLERRRWLERRPPATRIDVNTAAAHLDYWRDGRHVDRRRVIVGQPGWETPQLGSPIFRLVANPTWTVPKSIEEDEIAPLGEGYLLRNNMVRRDGWIVQLPGPTNALGLVKFDMRNDHAIYLHDTPAKPLFAENQRHFSHGCVRVDDALGFARLIAEHDGKSAEFERALASGDETFVGLERQIPVRLLYHTAFVSGGRVVFRTDPYGWDDDVAEALGLDRRQRRTLRSHLRDVGP